MSTGRTPTASLMWGFDVQIEIRRLRGQEKSVRYGVSCTAGVLNDLSLLVQVDAPFPRFFPSTDPHSCHKREGHWQFSRDRRPTIRQANTSGFKRRVEQTPSRLTASRATLPSWSRSSTAAPRVE